MDVLSEENKIVCQEREKVSELIYGNDNGITLCVPCHRKTYGEEHLLGERFRKMIKEKSSGKNSKVLQ